MDVSIAPPRPVPLPRYVKLTSSTLPSFSLFSSPFSFDIQVELTPSSSLLLSLLKGYLRAFLFFTVFSHSQNPKMGSHYIYIHHVMSRVPSRRQTTRMLYYLHKSPHNKAETTPSVTRGDTGYPVRSWRGSNFKLYYFRSERT